MKKKDREFLKSILGEGKLYEVKFNDYFKKCYISPSSNYISYDSSNANHIETVIEESNLKTVRIIKQLFNVDKIFMFCSEYDTMYWEQEKHENEGWQIVNPNSEHKMFDCSCKFIVAIDKSINIENLNNTVIEDITIEV